MEYATIVVMLALAEYFYFTARVGANREKLEMNAPACTGNERFERLFRVQQNTLEQLIIFIPAAYTFAYYVSSLWVLVPGVLFIIGRLMYSSAYLLDPKKRGPGMIATITANLALVLGTLISVVVRVI